jgi:diaminopimelate decarboxylase
MLNIARNLLLKRALRHQKTCWPPDLSLWGLSTNGRGQLSVGGLDATDLMQQFGSPLLVVHQELLLQHAREMLAAFSAAPAGSRVYYSYKTNCIPAILAELHALGIGAEVISPYELWLADRLGMRGDNVIYNGVDKTDDSIDLALRMNVGSINVDHLDEIERIARIAARRGQRATVGVRLGLVQKAQFGLGVGDGESMEACRRILARRDVLDLRCVHFNVTSNSKSSADHTGALRRALWFIGELKRTLGADIGLLDVGGGFGVPTTKNMTGVEYLLYRGLGVTPTAPDPQTFQPIGAYVGDLVSEVRNWASQNGVAAPALAAEPGRFVTSRAELLLTRVKAVKRRSGGVPMAITDAGRLSVTFPCDFEYHTMFLANRPQAAPQESYTVTGRVCTSADWLVRNRLLPAITPGDTLAVMDAGAYFSSYSSNFAFPRPAIVMVGQGTATIVREAETFEHLVAMDAVPQLQPVAHGRP